MNYNMPEEIQKMLEKISKEKKVDYTTVLKEYQFYIDQPLDYRERKKHDYDYIFIPEKKTTKLLIVEDGSIDLENCEQDLLDAGIKCIVYRRGSQPPRLYDLGE